MKILHTADWQLGKPFGSISDPDKRALVRQARINVIERIAALSKEEKVDAVLVAGDIFDSSHPSTSVISAGLLAIGQIPCPVYLIPGNHDHGGPGGIWENDFLIRERPSKAPNLIICNNPEPLVTDNFTLYPCPLRRRSETADTIKWLRDPEVFKNAPADSPRIILAHGTTQDFSGKSADPDDDAGASNFLSLDTLPWEEIDYMAIGDWHGTKEVRPKAWYSGTPEYDRFPKGSDYTAGQVLIVETVRGKAPKVRPVPVGKLTWQEHTMSFHSDTDLETFRGWIDKTLEGRAREDLLRIRLDGALGMEASQELEHLRQSLDARLLRLMFENNTVLEPKEEELTALTGDISNPLIARVATVLKEIGDSQSEQAGIARLALRHLYLTRNKQQ